jgi:pyruvate,water dikinase
MTLAHDWLLPDPSYASDTWRYDDLHNPWSHPPLIVDMLAAVHPQPADGKPGTIFVHGFSFHRERAPLPADAPLRLPDADGARERWVEEWLPATDVLVARLRAFDPRSVAAGTWTSVLGASHREYGRVFTGVHLHCLVPALQAAEWFVDAYARRLGEDRRAEASALLQGLPNRALDRAIALWELSRLVRLDGWRVSQTYGPTQAQRALQARLPGVLEEFGQTTDGWLQDAPSWEEDPGIAWRVVLEYAALDDDRSPALAAARQRERREQLEEALRRDAPDLARLLPAPQQYLPIAEDHNVLCDQRLAAASRRRWLAIADWLGERGLLARRDDVFYYRQDELVALLEGGERLAAATLDQRREQQRAWRSERPPRVLGAGAAEPAAVPAAQPIAGAVIRGIAASPGVHRGRARLVRSLADAARLAPGDVLLAAAAAPAWTLYFTIAGSVVTDAGGALSHAAIVAREFGLPAVVGTADATRRIPDGATVLVDGAAGTVTIEQP